MGYLLCHFVLKPDCTRCLSLTLRNSVKMDLGYSQGIKILKAPQMTLRYSQLSHNLENHLFSFFFFTTSSFIIIISLPNKCTNCLKYCKDISGYISKRSKEVIWYISLISHDAISKSGKPEESINYFHKEQFSTHFSYSSIGSLSGGLSSEGNSVVVM